MSLIYNILFGLMTAINEILDMLKPRRNYAASVTTPPTTPQPPVSLELVQAREKAEYWRKSYSECKKELEDAQQEAKELSDREGKALEKVASVRQAYDKLKESYTVAVGRGKRYEEQLQEAKAEIAQLRKRTEGCVATRRALETLRQEAEEMRRELQHVRAAHQDTKSLLDVRTAKLRDAQAYMFKDDVISHSDVQRMVEGLNAQSFQLAALVTDSCTFMDVRPSDTDLRASYERVERLIGGAACNLLLSTSHVEDPIWVQMCLQATITTFAHWTINAWDLRFDSGKNALLTHIHKRLLVNGMPMCSGLGFRN